MGLAFLLLLANTGLAEAKFGFVTKWGSPGDGPGQFHWAEGIATDAQGRVYVVDHSDQVFETVHERILVFTATGQFVGSWGRPGQGDGQFATPTDIAIGPAGNIYVAEWANERVQMFAPNSQFIRKWDADASGPPPCCESRGFFGIATDPTGNVYVSEYSNDQILKFDANGNFLMKWGDSGTGDGQLHIPMDVATDSAGNVYVVSDVRWIQKFSPVGAPLGRWRVDDSQTVSGNANGVATDGAGNVYATSGSEVRKFTSNGTFLMEFGGPGNGNGQFTEANYIATDSVGNVYVTDKQRVQKFGRVPEITITKGPKRKTARRKARFKFTADEAGTTFECRLDRRKWKPCTSPTRVKRLKRGKHVFRVRGTVIGNRGKAAKRRWKVVRPD